MKTYGCFKQPLDGSDSDSLDDLVDEDEDLIIPAVPGIDSDFSASDAEPEANPSEEDYADDNSSEFDPDAPDSDDSMGDQNEPTTTVSTRRTVATNTENEDDKPSSSSKSVSLLNDLNEDEEEDETVRAIIAAIKKPRTAPSEIKLNEYITDISFHPKSDIIALATILGDIHLYKYANEENTKLKTIEVHTKACRDIEFSNDGRQLLSCSKDKSIMITDVQTEKLKRFYENAHPDAVNKLHVINENVFATGDDTGTVKVWDSRTNDVIFGLKEVEDYISDMLTNDVKKLLLFTSGDGYLTTINIGSRKLFVQSEPYEEELTCMGLYRGDSKLAVGTSKGSIYTYNWGQFGYHCDVFPGIKKPISVMVPITDRIGCVAGEEGIIRATHIAPYRNLGIVGHHTLPVIALDINRSGELIASSSDNNDVRFWNVKYFEDFGDIKYNAKHNSYKESRHNLPSSKFSNTSDFFSDLSKTDDNNEN